MKIFILFAVFVAVQSKSIEPRIEREDGKTPWSERQYLGWTPHIVSVEFKNILRPST